tara:strand:+ start:26 stop:550 length:525 start_codon:yes stop_codon:yes gene_type:complete
MAIFVVLIFWISCGFYCGVVAESKGYSGIAWTIGGFFFGFIALISAAGLPDRKLRKYIRQIGGKQNAIKDEKQNVIKDETAEDQVLTISGITTISFVLPTSSNEEEMYKRLISEIGRNKEVKKKFDKLKIESYEFSESLLGGREFVLLGKDLRTLFVMSGKELNAIQYQWTGEF